MKIRQRIISALAAAAAAFSLMSATTFAQNLKYDANGDGNVNAKDALYILRAAIKPNPDSRLDVNGDGNVNAKDALFILRYSINPEKYDTPETPETTSAESILVDYEKKWCYNLLSDNQKEAYKVLVKGILKCESKIDLLDCRISKTDYDKVFDAILADNPHIISTRGAGSVMPSGNYLSYIKYTYNLSAAQCSQIMQNVEKNTASVIAEAKTLKTDYERAKLFHDWIINRTDYIANEEKYTWRLDGPIVYAKSVCEGYSKAFSYLCQSVGIECVCISGIANGGGHMWNMVKIDGKWYHADVTWDDPLTSDGRPVLRYNYFLISDAKIREDHTIDSTFKIPTAASSYAA